MKTTSCAPKTIEGPSLISMCGRCDLMISTHTYIYGHGYQSAAEQLATYFFLCREFSTEDMNFTFKVIPENKYTTFTTTTRNMEDADCGVRRFKCLGVVFFFVKLVFSIIQPRPHVFADQLLHTYPIPICEFCGDYGEPLHEEIVTKIDPPQATHDLVRSDGGVASGSAEFLNIKSVTAAVILPYCHSCLTGGVATRGYKRFIKAVKRRSPKRHLAALPYGSVAGADFQDPSPKWPKLSMGILSAVSAEDDTKMMHDLTFIFCQLHNFSNPLHDRVCRTCTHVL